MRLSEIFSGSIGLIYSSSCIMMILIMMFIVSLRLFIRRGKKAYFSFTVSLIVIISHYVLIIGLEVSNRGHDISALYIAQVLEVLAFILINMGIYQLYNTSKTRVYVLFYSFIALTFLIAAVRYYALQTRENSSEQFILLHNIWLELYLFILIFLCFYLVSPFIGQNKKYRLALTIYFITHLAHVTDGYIMEHPAVLFTVAQSFLPILYYCFVFLIVFDRVVELMQATYKSSITDGLTGLYNRRFFFSRVSQYVSRQMEVAVIFTDIDNFKKLNDTKGHHVGDAALKQVAEILLDESEGIGAAGRYGGEELVVLITDPKQQVADVAERIRGRVQAETIVTVSVGYSKFKKGMTGSELMKQADDAMYHSKSEGKNRVTYYAAIKGSLGLSPPK